MKKPQQNYDFLIIGQGLAGSILASKLIDSGRRVAVIDNSQHNSSSRVAAGIINPITGHRLNLTEGFETLFPCAQAFYLQLELKLGIKIWHPIRQFRLLKNQGQKQHHSQRTGQAAYQAYMQAETVACDLFKDNNFGTIRINRTATVDAKTFLSSFQSKLKELGCLFLNKVDYAAIRNNGSIIEANGIAASTIIFCEGYQAIYNPWLADLTFKLSKGEVLTIATEPVIPAMLNWGHWLAPYQNYVKLGSSFDWYDLSTESTVKTEQSLMNSLYQHTHISAHIEMREAGIRPTTVNRKPFIGRISGFDNGYCFNGFGSKGCLLIPYYAELLCQHLTTGLPLPPELRQCL